MTMSSGEPILLPAHARPAHGSPGHSFAEIDGALASFDLADYVAQARERGRIELPAETRRRACSLYEQLEDFRAAHTTIPRQLDDTLELALRTLSSEWFLSHSAFPRYRAYLNLAVLNWFLGTHRRTPYQAVWTRCARAIAVLLRDALAFETGSLAGVERRGGESFDRGAVEERIARLEALTAAFGLAAQDPCAPSPGAWTMPAAWHSYIADPALALVYLTAFPLTREHDEYMFIRTLQISECCFWAILTASLATAESLKRGDLAVAEKCLTVALPFARLLTPLLGALKTMTGARFERFREETGAASALQSRTYQLMQIALTGVHPATVDVVVQVDELTGLRFYDQPWFVTLSDLAAPLYADGGHQLALTRHLDALSHELRKWRKVHRGIVRSYLASRPQGTGGTNGAEYLRHTVDTTIAETARRPRSDEQRWRRWRQQWPPYAIFAATGGGRAEPVLSPEN